MSTVAPDGGPDCPVCEARETAELAAAMEGIEDMSGCCDEWNCRRTEPIRLYAGDFTGGIYAATRSKKRGPGQYVAYEKHDVTEAMREFIRRNPSWVRAVLDTVSEANQSR
jgi:hypothetical protein